MTVLSKFFAARTRAPAPAPALKPSAAVLYQPYAVETVLSVLARLPDPDLVLTKQGMGRHELRKLETDDEIAAALETRREAVIATPWRLEPYEGEIAQWLWEELEPHIEPLLRGAWSAVPYGLAVQEVIYRRDGARIGLAQVQEKPLEWFEPTRDGLLIYTPPSGGLPHPVDTSAKFLLTRRNPTYRNPYGEALLSRAYWPWFFRHNGWRFWMQFLERFAEPLLLGQVPALGHSAADDQARVDAFVSALQSLGYSNTVAVPRIEGQGDIKSVTESAAGEFARVEEALIARFQRLILGQTLTSNVGDSGSYAAAKVHNEVREDKRRADLRLVNATAQHLVDALWTLNGFAGEPPAFLLQDDQGLESARAERDVKLVQAGILRFTEPYILAHYDVEPGDFEIPESTAPSAEPPPGETDVALSARPAQRFTADQQLVEDLADRALAAARSPIAPERLRAVIAAAESPEDLAERLAALYTGVEDVAFQELVERALFTADVMGFYTAEKRVGVAS